MTEWAQGFEMRGPGVGHASWTDYDIDLPGRGRSSIREAGLRDAPTVVLLGWKAKEAKKGKEPEKK